MPRKDSLSKPLVPPLKKASRGRLQNLSVTRLIPNIATIIALCMGLSSIRFVLLNQYDYALAAILTAAFFDTLDGRLARLLGATSDFGAELDSLSIGVNRNREIVLLSQKQITAPSVYIVVLLYKGPVRRYTIPNWV